MRWSARALVELGNLHRRFWAVACAIAGPRATYAVMGTLGRLLYRLLEPLRSQSEHSLRAAFGGHADARDVAHLAKRAYMHRAWSLADLYLAERLLHPGTYHRHGGQISEHGMQLMQRARQAGCPVIFVTGYYGPYDLLPVFLGYNGIRPAVVYQPHPNAAFDAFRQRVRARSGCEMVPVAQAAVRFASLLAKGGSVAIVADHQAEAVGLDATFLGMPTRAYRSVALLAWRYEAAVVVAGIRRTGEPFRFELVMADLILPDDWKDRDDPIAYITQRYLLGLEHIVKADPSQYLWAHPRADEPSSPRQADRSPSPVQSEPRP